MTFGDPGTIRRLIGDFYVRPDAAGLVNATFGIAIVQPAVTVVGATGLISPTTNADQEWLWWRYVGLRGSGANDTSDLGQHIKIESRAMRKFKQADQLAFVAQSTGGGSVAFEFDVGVRVLVALG